MSDASEATQFKKGQPRPPKAGRRRGTPNKFSTMKAAIMQAIEELGGVEFIKQVARKKPEVVLQLAGRLIPHEYRLGTTDEVPPPVIHVHFREVPKRTQEAREADAPAEEAIEPGKQASTSHLPFA